MTIYLYYIVLFKTSNACLPNSKVNFNIDRQALDVLNKTCKFKQNYIAAVNDVIDYNKIVCLYMGYG